MNIRNPIIKFKSTETAVFLLYLSLSLITVFIHSFLVDIPYESYRLELHQQVINGTAPAPIQYRILPFYLSEFLQKAGVSFRASYIFIRYIFTLLSAAFLHLFLKKWFEIDKILIGVLFFFCILPLTYVVYFMQPGCMINLFVFILGYWVIREKKEYWLVPILFLFTWNRETVVLLIMVYFFYRYDELPLKKLLTRTLLFILVFGVSYLLIKKFYGYHELYGNIDWAKTNLTDYKTYIYAFLLFGVFGWWGMKDLKSKPKFLVRALLMFPYFFVTHWFVGYLSETRYYYPLLPIIIPLGLHTLFGIKEGYPDSETKKVDNYLTKQFKLFYFIFFAIFLISFKIYFQKTYHPYIEKTRITTSYDKAIENGFFYAEKGDYEKAISDFTKAIELSPENSETYNNRGFAYMNKGYYDEALADFNKAIEINPKYSKAYNNRGLSYYNKKLYDEAISDFNKAIELDPKYSKAYNNRGLTYKEKGIYDKALADYNIALKLAPDNPRISWNIAIIYCEYKQWDKAIQYINRVIELNPTYPEARKYLDIAKTQMENAGNKTEKQ